MFDNIDIVGRGSRTQQTLKLEESFQEIIQVMNEWEKQRIFYFLRTTQLLTHSHTEPKKR